MRDDVSVAQSIGHLVDRLERGDAGIDLVDGGRVHSLSHLELRERVAQRAADLAEEGVGPGMHVALSLRSDLEHVVAFLALSYLGAVPVSVKPARESARQHELHLARVVERYGIDLGYHTLVPVPGMRRVGAGARGGRAAFALPAPRGPADTAFVQFTSGSVSEPKPIRVSNGALVANLGQIVAMADQGRDSVVFSFVPLSHDMGLVGGLLSCLLAQNHLVLADTRTFFTRADSCLELAVQRGMTTTVMPDSALRFLTRVLARRRQRAGDALPLGRLTSFVCGAEPIRLETVRAFLEEALPRGFDPAALLFCYGLAEATLLATYHRFESIERSFDVSNPRAPVARLGAPVEGLELRVAGAGGRGRIELRGPTVNLDPESPHAAPDAWLDTGDIGYLSNGELYVCGRDGERLNVSGRNVFAADLEQALERAGVAQECCALVEDERLYVLVVARPAKDDTAARVQRVLANEFGVSANSVVLGGKRDVLRTSSGKVRRGATLARLRERSRIAEPR